MVFTSDIDSIHFVQHHSPLGSSDHECLSWQYECLFDNPSNEGMPTAYNFWRGNYSVICQELDEIDWESLFSNNPIDENWNLFKEEVASAVSKHVPTISRKVQTKNLHGGLTGLQKQLNRNNSYSLHSDILIYPLTMLCMLI